MKSLVIGASGLVGSHLLKTCQARNWDAIGTFHDFAQPDLTFLELQDIDAARSVWLMNLKFLVRAHL